ncbi:dienelactone hydrolase endo-1,3,1,4-beta-D-glucanase [Hysterangium stoloniferum]|nr:dienelactone hydrolase endo-1,3,1,4-beta-D-glucanase [Hysterangium stoloniferum]
MTTTGVCERCIQGEILEGEPTGVFEGPSYFKAAPSPSKRAVVILTDVFGLKIANPKLLADKYSQVLKCDVWVPDLFEGRPPFTEAQLGPLLHDVPGTPSSLFEKIKFFFTILQGLPGFIRNRPSIVDNRVITFARHLKSEKKYEKIGVIGFCFGGAQAIRLCSTDLFDSAVVAHPGTASKAEIQAMKIATSWICAEEDGMFPTPLRNEAEAIFKRKHETDKLNYEFHDYKGTVHGFAARPKLSNAEIKKAFEAAFDQAVKWFEKTLPVAA